MSKSKANLAVVSTLLCALIPKMDKATKHQMRSLVSLVVSSMFIFMPFAPAAAAAGPVSYTIHKTVIDVAGKGPEGNVTNAGDIIRYQVNVTNDGDLNFSVVNVTDSLIDLTGPIESNSDNRVLEAGENWTYTGNYTVTQDDMNNNGTLGNGFIVNNATVNCDNIGLQNDSVQVLIEQNANCTIDKIVIDVAGQGPGGNITAEGDIVSYQLNVTNNGNMDLTNVTVTDPLINNLTGNNDTILNVGEIWTYNGNCTVTRADITNNSGEGLVNNATVDCDQLGPKNDTVQVPIDPSCSIEKTIISITHINGSGPEGNVTAAGDIILYQVNVTNTGIVDFTNVTVTDSLIQNFTGNNDTALNVGETWTYTGNYTVTQEDMNSDGNGTGFLINNATINCDQLGPKNDTVQVPIDWNPALNLNKTVTGINGQEAGGNVTKEGDIVSYMLNVTNTGNVDLTNVTVTDPFINTLTGPTSSINNDTVLNVGETWTYNGNYTITRADLTNNNGDGFINNATVDSDQQDPQNDSVQVPIDTIFSIDQTVTDVAGRGPSGNATAVGDKIGFRVNVINNGKTDLTNATITDSLIDELAGPTGDDVDPGVLNPGETWVYAGNYTVTQADLNNNGTAGNGFIENIASMNFDQLGPKNDTVQVPVERTPHYSLQKSIIDPDPTGDCIINAAGDKVPYRIVICNDGNVDLTGILVDDPMISLAGPTGDDIGLGILNPGETWVYDGIYFLTQDDIDNGNGDLINIAAVNSNELPQGIISVIQPIDQKVDLSIQKSVIGIDEAGDFMINNPGEIINYQIAIANNGDVSLHDIHVTDSLIGDLSRPTGDSFDSGVLNPGEVWVYKYNYVVTQADIASNGNSIGFITNTATVKCDEHSSESSSIIVPIIPAPNFETDITPEPGAPVASFSTSTTSGYVPLSVQFTDQSTGTPTSWSWDFESDGVADSSTQSPAYTYNAPGTYVAKLTVSNANGSDSKTATINVMQKTSSGGGGSTGGSHGSGENSGTANVVSSGSTDNTGAANVPQPENNTSNVIQSTTPANVPTPVKNTTSTPVKQSKKTPGFEIISGITALLGAMYLYRRR